MEEIAETKQRPPLHIRLTARWSVISLIIAGASMALASVTPPSLLIRAPLKVVIIASSTIGVTALLLWVAFSGLHFAFSKRENENLDGHDDRFLW